MVWTQSLCGQAAPSSPKPLIVDEMYGISEALLCDKYHNVETSSSHSSFSSRGLGKKLGDGRKSSMPKRLRLSRDGESESSSPGYSSSPHDDLRNISDQNNHDRSDDGIAVIK